MGGLGAPSLHGIHQGPKQLFAKGSELTLGPRSLCSKKRYSADSHSRIDESTPPFEPMSETCGGLAARAWASRFLKSFWGNHIFYLLLLKEIFSASAMPTAGSLCACFLDSKIKARRDFSLRLLFSNAGEVGWKLLTAGTTRACLDDVHGKQALVHRLGIAAAGVTGTEVAAHATARRARNPQQRTKGLIQRALKD